MTGEVEVVKSSVDGFELPCGYLDPEGKLHTDIVVREISGPEEEILAARNMPLIKKINRLMANCTVSIGTYTSGMESIILDLTQGDRFYLMFAIRRVTLGNEMPFIIKCPACSQEQMLTLDLADLEVKKMRDPKLRTYPVTLPKSGKKLVMKVLTGHGEMVMSKATQTGKDVASMSILPRIESFDGKPPTVEDLKALGMADRNFLRDIWQEHEGGIDTDLQVECPSCGEEHEAAVDISSEGFFNPLGVSRSWKKKSSI